METPELNRRDFHRLSMAAFGGVLAGAVAGCDSSPPAPPKPPAGGTATPPAAAGAGAADAAAGGADAALADSVAAVGVEKHVCRGLNACKNQGAKGENACAGQGACATVESHSCAGLNECKGQGGCGKAGVENDCKGKGGCNVPLMDDAWSKARKIFEAKMKKSGKEFGAAPAEVKS